MIQLFHSDHKQIAVVVDVIVTQLNIRYFHKNIYNGGKISSFFCSFPLAAFDWDEKFLLFSDRFSKTNTDQCADEEARWSENVLVMTLIDIQVAMCLFPGTS